SFGQGTTISSEIPRGTDLPSPCFHSSVYAKQRVQNFLTISSIEENGRLIESGTANISISEIRPLETPEKCQEVNDFILSNSIYQHQFENVDRTRYQYQTDNFIFVFWISNRMRTAPPDKFIVIRKDFSNAWVYHQ
ncbi:MAG: hypothetical protein RIF46_08865, partial [Cyclobacteriaceae bacterium]